MAVTIKQKGAGELEARTAKAIGESVTARRDQERAERQEAQALQLETQKKAREAAMEFELEKMQMRSQQEFQQELTERQWEYEKYNRAKAWEIEKMETVSRLDFEKREKERATKEAKTAAGVQAIKDSDNIYPSQEAKDKAVFDFVFKQEQGYYPPKQEQGQRPPSATRQKGEIEAQFELEGYTPEDLTEIGLDPKDFPNVGRESQGLPRPTTQEEYDMVAPGAKYEDSSGNIRTKS